jgi:SAM-dependent methyltransferase
VYSLGVVEHFRETAQAIREHWRVLKPGGLCLIVVPNLISPYSMSILYHALRGNEVSLASVGKRFTKRRLGEMVRAAGFTRSEIIACYGHAFLRILPFGYNPAVAACADVLTLSPLFGHWLACAAWKECG